MMEYISVMEQFDLISELGLPPPSSSSSSSSSSVEHQHGKDDNESTSPAVAEVPKPHSGRLFANIDWKTSSTSTNTTTDPFPDLKIQIVNEIVNTGGTIHVNDIPTDTGKEISVEEFHNILLDAIEEKEEEEPTPSRPLKRAKVEVDDDDTIIQKKERKEVVLIDVRNTFEHAIGHFVHPHLTTANNGSGVSLEDNDNNIDGNNEGNKNQEAPTTSSSSNNHRNQQQQPKPAINPNTVTFSHFDSTFCSQYSESLKDKKVLMYCTGGIRCVKASAMLKQRGVQDVSHLSGGIHRYLERYGSNGFYKGKMFVFDQRIALDADDMMLKREEEEEVDDVGGGEDNSDSGDNAVASKAVLDGTKSNEQQQQQQKANDVVGKCIECNNPYDEISGANLCTVCRDLLLICPSCRDKLDEFHCERHQTWKNAYFTFLERYTTEQLQYQKDKLQVLHDSCPPKKHKNVRKTLRKQMNKIDTRINDIVEGKAVVEPNAKRRCRTCFESNDICDGRCWGFWRQSQAPKTMTPEPIVEVKIGDRVTIGPNWNQIRLGYKDARLGTVTNI
ncbi:hypothetical protein ACHAWC_001123, partial [Mediolabrus comicus]